MAKETRVLQDYQFQTAGRTWTIPTYTLTKLRDGSWGVTRKELQRVYEIISARIRQGSDPLTPTEFEFLSDVHNVGWADYKNLFGDGFADDWLMGEDLQLTQEQSQKFRAWLKEHRAE